MNNTLVIVATITAKAGHEATVKQALAQVVSPSQQEAGCISYQLHSDNETVGRFFMLEEWQNADVLKQHEATPHFQALVAAVGGLADIQIAKLTRIS